MFKVGDLVRVKEIQGAGADVVGEYEGQTGTVVHVMERSGIPYEVQFSDGENYLFVPDELEAA